VAVCLTALGRQGTRLRHAREELEILLRQSQTEYRDGLNEVRRSIGFLERSGTQLEDALRGGLTRSLRAKAMQLLRAGNTPDRAAAELGLGRSEMRLLANVSRILQSQN
jgi:hypothetical protein